jgi:DNA phosphorothioation-dependent restriction protein DptH
MMQQPPLFLEKFTTNLEKPPLQSPVPQLTAPAFEILLGDTKPTQQFGLLGRVGNKNVALDLNGTNTISIFGVQGGGKSYTVGTVVEMATQSFSRINLLPSPLASVIFHYHASQDYPPEFVSMVAPNSKLDEIRTLLQEYEAVPGRLENVLILTSADKVEERQAEFPSIQVEPILFSSSEISIKDWQFLMGVFGDQMYMKQVTLIMRRLRRHLTLETLREEIDASDLSDSQKALVNMRLDFAEPFIDDGHRLADVLQPGRLVIVDLRDELVTKEEALGLFVVMLNIFANTGRNQDFNKLIVFDEAHKYMNNDELAGYIVEVVRQMRHQGVSILIASQDPPSLPNAIIELSTLVVLHRFNAPKWLKHVQQSITALSDLQPGQLANLQPGEAYVWATKSTDNNFMRHAVKIRFRPRVTQHGGGTKTAAQE